MEELLYWFMRGLVALGQSLPLKWVARFGRCGGAVAHYVDGRHRRVAQRNLAMCFPEKSPKEIKALAKENFKRFGENIFSAIKTASMPVEQLRQHMEIVGGEKLLGRDKIHGPISRIFAIGHFGNFELFAL